MPIGDRDPEYLVRPPGARPGDPTKVPVAPQIPQPIGSIGNPGKGVGGYAHADHVHAGITSAGSGLPAGTLQVEDPGAISGNNQPAGTQLNGSIYFNQIDVNTIGAYGTPSPGIWYPGQPGVYLVCAMWDTFVTRHAGGAINAYEVSGFLSLVDTDPASVQPGVLYGPSTVATPYSSTIAWLKMQITALVVTAKSTAALEIQFGVNYAAANFDISVPQGSPFQTGRYLGPTA